MGLSLSLVLDDTPRVAAGTLYLYMGKIVKELGKVLDILDESSIEIHDVNDLLLDCKINNHCITFRLSDVLM